MADREGERPRPRPVPGIAGVDITSGSPIGKLWALTPIPISSHVSQTEYQNACRRVKLLLLQVVKEERVNNKPSWRRERTSNHHGESEKEEARRFSRVNAEHGICTKSVQYGIRHTE